MYLSFRATVGMDQREKAVRMTFEVPELNCGRKNHTQELLARREQQWTIQQLMCMQERTCMLSETRLSFTVRRRGPDDCHGSRLRR
jgi:hypothetical protein